MSRNWKKHDDNFYVSDDGYVIRTGYEVAVLRPVDQYVGHSAFHSIEGLGLCAYVMSAALPPEIEALPGYVGGVWPEKRIAAVRAHKREVALQCKALADEVLEPGSYKLDLGGYSAAELGL